MTPNELSMAMVFGVMIFFFGIPIARVFPIIGPKVHFEDERIFTESAIIIGSAAFPSVVFALILIFAFPDIEAWVRILYPIVLYAGQYAGTIGVLWNRGLCRLCHNEDPWAKKGICKECLQSVAYFHDGEIVWKADGEM